VRLIEYAILQPKGSSPLGGNRPALLQALILRFCRNPQGHLPAGISWRILDYGFELTRLRSGKVCVLRFFSPPPGGLT